MNSLYSLSETASILHETFSDQLNRCKQKCEKQPFKIRLFDSLIDQISLFKEVVKSDEIEGQFSWFDRDVIDFSVQFLDVDGNASGDLKQVLKRIRDLRFTSIEEGESSECDKSPLSSPTHPSDGDESPIVFNVRDYDSLFSSEDSLTLGIVFSDEGNEEKEISSKAQREQTNSFPKVEDEKYKRSSYEGRPNGKENDLAKKRRRSCLDLSSASRAV